MVYIYATNWLRKKQLVLMIPVVSGLICMHGYAYKTQQISLFGIYRNIVIYTPSFEAAHNTCLYHLALVLVAYLQLRYTALIFVLGC